eukprot:5515585-Karenia_brevis.AAC.1
MMMMMMMMVPTRLPVGSAAVKNFSSARASGCELISPTSSSPSCFMHHKTENDGHQGSDRDHWAGC